MLVKVELPNGKTKEFHGEFIWMWGEDEQNISAGGGFLGGGGTAIGIQKNPPAMVRWFDLRTVGESGYDCENPFVRWDACDWGIVVWQGYAANIEIERDKE